MNGKRKRPTQVTAKKLFTTYLDWDSFNLKLEKENHLTGADNWHMWITMVQIALAAIGYEDGDREYLTSIDEARLAQGIISNIGEGPLAAIEGIREGTAILDMLMQYYSPGKHARQVDLFSQLWHFSWDRKTTASDYMVAFRRLIRLNREADVDLDQNKEIKMFVQRVGDQDWATKMMAWVRQNPSSTAEQVYDIFAFDFRDCHCHKGSGAVQPSSA
ncbi:hypothetical protein F4818DRAFT_457432 [Hypoxylon cercidicola]|nr:hypothetical protein F4818DRAFT_457432 [Hypoxylon cercidicola]